MSKSSVQQISKREYRNGVRLSVLGFGGMVLVGMEQPDANALVAEALAGGINYFDVAPLYGQGEAETKLGVALGPYRRETFLAGKTLERRADSAERELERSLRLLRTDYLDLYQFHAVSKLKEVEEIFAPNGALEAFCRARELGKIRYIGFSAHSITAALSMLDRFDFDSILFPVNYVCYARGKFGPQVMQRAKERRVSRIALKAMAYTPWREGEERRYPKCWYRPVEDRELARQALRFTLSEDVTAAIPPGDERLFRMALELASDLTPLTQEERRSLLASANGLRPVLHA